MKLIEFFLSKHFWRGLRMECRAFFYKRVDAKTLMDICECINPPHLRKNATAWGNRDSSLAEEEKLASMIEAAGLRKHILLSSDKVGRRAIKFVKIMVRGVVKMNLGGRFNSWEFDSVKFADFFSISIYPPYHDSNSASMVFRNSICGDYFMLSFIGVSKIHICDSKFMATADINIGADDIEFGADTAPSVEKLLRQMLDNFLQHYVASTVEFSGNFLKTVCLHNKVHHVGETKIPNPNLGHVRFVNGNHIGMIYLTDIMLPDNKPVGEKKVETISAFGHRLIKVSDVHFDAHEHIEMHPGLETNMHYKKYFVALKKQAIEKHDREAEFAYGRKERYFDRGIATRWQDKFPLWWSYIVSSNGISWFRPAAILLGGQYALAVIFIGWLGGCCDYAAWFQAAVESLNPLSSLPDMLKSLGDGNESCKKSLSAWENSISASIYNAVRRIFSLALLYEIVKVLRRFSN